MHRGALMCQDMRPFFMLLAFLLISFGLTFSVLMSPATTSRVAISSLAGAAEVAVAGQGDMQVFGSLEVRGTHALRGAGGRCSHGCGQRSTAAGAVIRARVLLPLLAAPQDSMLQLFTIMFGDVQYSTLKTIISVNTVSRALTHAHTCACCIALPRHLGCLAVARARRWPAGWRSAWRRPMRCWCSSCSSTCS